MKKSFLIFLLFIFVFSLLVFFIPGAVNAGDDPACRGPNGEWGIVRCGCGTLNIDAAGNCTNCCGILDIFAMLGRIYDFIVWYVATPLAIIGLTVGGIFMLISAGNPQLLSRGKEFIKWSIIGLVLVLCSWLIIDFILKVVLGYTANWNQL